MIERAVRFDVHDACVVRENDARERTKLRDERCVQLGGIDMERASTEVGAIGIRRVRADRDRVRRAIGDHACHRGGVARVTAARDVQNVEVRP